MRSDLSGEIFKAKDVIVWINFDTHRVRLEKWSTSVRPRADWGDIIGASYTEWREMNNDQRVRLMLETVIDLAMQGFDLAHVLRVFSEVVEFRALGSKGYPMCRALTGALVGQCLESDETMSFEELLDHYGADWEARARV